MALHPTHDAPVSPLNLLEGGRTDGYYVNRTCMGTYIHGILDNPAFIDFLLEPFADKLADAGTAFDYQQFKEDNMINSPIMCVVTSICRLSTKY